MADPRMSALLVFDEEDEIIEAMVFEDNTDAVDVFGDYLEQGKPCVLTVVTYYGAGERPPSPPKQQRMDLG